MFASLTADSTLAYWVIFAVKDANTQLNEVAQRIRYVGLSADEIRAIMNETEAEEALTGSSDTSETRSMLEEIEDLIRDPQISASSYSEGASFGLDLDLDFSSDASDIFSLDFLGGDTSSFSNLRGAELYKAAKKRCSTVISQCKNAGATANQITGNYDLAIDKDCVAYEQGLNKMNDTLRSNVRSANLMLQKARLAVLQNKNKYDAKGCIAALDTCMKDDMVCGDNYYKCIDPTKVYIDENGEVVLGQNISDITAFMQNYNNASINNTFLETANGITISKDGCKQDGDGTDNNPKTNDGKCVVKYLLSKIGTGAKATDGGLCRAVLDKCQAYTYQNDAYQPYNDIVVNYIQRAMVNIRAAQQQIISDYASNCMVDIANCYNQQVSQLNSWSSSNSISGIYKVMRGACRNVALTCGYAVFDADPDLSGESSPDDYITAISEMFYQSLLCDDDEIFVEGQCVNPKKCTESGGTWNSNTLTCSDCPDLSVLNNGQCVAVANAVRNKDSGDYECSTGYVEYDDPYGEKKCVICYPIVLKNSNAGSSDVTIYRNSGDTALYYSDKACKAQITSMNGPTISGKTFKCYHAEANGTCSTSATNDNLTYNNGTEHALNSGFSTEYKQAFPVYTQQ